MNFLVDCRRWNLILVLCFHLLKEALGGGGAQLGMRTSVCLCWLCRVPLGTPLCLRSKGLHLHLQGGDCPST